MKKAIITGLAGILTSLACATNISSLPKIDNVNSSYTIKPNEVIVIDTDGNGIADVITYKSRPDIALWINPTKSELMNQFEYQPTEFFMQIIKPTENIDPQIVIKPEHSEQYK